MGCLNEEVQDSGPGTGDPFIMLYKIGYEPYEVFFLSKTSPEFDNGNAVIERTAYSACHWKIRRHFIFDS